jgi:uncharacterized protein YPO0396
MRTILPIVIGSTLLMAAVPVAPSGDREPLIDREAVQERAEDMREESGDQYGAELDISAIQDRLIQIIDRMIGKLNDAKEKVSTHPESEEKQFALGMIEQTIAFLEMQKQVIEGAESLADLRAITQATRDFIAQNKDAIREALQKASEEGFEKTVIGLRTYFTTAKAVAYAQKLQKQISDEEYEEVTTLITTGEEHLSSAESAYPDEMQTALTELAKAGEKAYEVQEALDLSM